MVETRRDARHRVLKAGKIESVGNPIDCRIRNISTSGAALEVASQVGIPDSFTLVLPEDGLRIACHVAWRRTYQLGVAFD